MPNPDFLFPSFLPHLLIGMLIYFISFGLMGIIHHYHYIYCCSDIKMCVVPALAPSIWLLHPFSMPLSFFEHFLIFWHQKMFQVHLLFFLSQAWNLPFLQGALVPFIGEWYLETKILERGVLIASRPSQRIELGNICMYINPCTHTHLNLFL